MGKKMDKIKRESPGRDNVLALMAALGLGTGIFAAFSNPILGFMITALTVISTLLLSINGIQQALFTGQKSANRVTDFQSRLLFWGSVTLLAFTPVLITEITLGLGMAIVGYLLLWISEKEGEEITENELIKITYLLVAAAAFFGLYLIPEILILTIFLPAGMYVWRLIPMETRDKLGA